jgi:hypothetical protein
MHITRNSLLGLAGLLAAVLAVTPARGFAAAATTAAQPQGGVTVTPAALTLTLKKGTEAAHSNFTIANSYRTEVALHFSFAQPVQTPGARSALSNVQITPQDVVVPAGASAVQTVTLTDSSSLAPGSQQLELVMTQQIAPGAGTVSIVPSIRLPLATVKEEGAVTSFAAAVQNTPAFSLTIPPAVLIVVRNTGNMAAVPRGYVSITDPRGREVSKGVLNTGSQAVTPGNSLRLSTHMVMVDHPWPPGPYHVQVFYGSGGGQQASLASVRMVYLPVWQILLAALIVAIIICIRQIWVESARLRQAKTAAPSGTPADRAAPQGGGA